MKAYRVLSLMLKSIVDEVENEDIIIPANQRGQGCWTGTSPDALIASILNQWHISNIIICETTDGNRHLVDGLQRMYYIALFVLYNKKLSKQTPNSLIKYRKKVKDEEGVFVKDENGNVVWEDTEFNIAGKTFDELPKELQERLLKYQIQVVQYDDCTMEEMLEVLRITNNHISMSKTQKAYTYMSKDLSEIINEIEMRGLFDDWVDSTKRTKGECRKMISDAVLLTYFKDTWKKDAIVAAKYLSDNAKEYMFEEIDDSSIRLSNIINEDTKFIIKNTKNIFLWLSLFTEFKKYDMEDERFNDFLIEFYAVLKDKEVEGTAYSYWDNSYSEVNKKKASSSIDKSSKDKGTVIARYDILETLMLRFFGIIEEPEEEIEKFSSENENTIVEDDEPIEVEEVKAAEIIEETGYYTTSLEDNTYNSYLPDSYYESVADTSLVKALGYTTDQIIDLGNYAMAVSFNINVSDLNEYCDIFDSKDYEDIPENINTVGSYLISTELKDIDVKTLSGLINISSYSLKEDIPDSVLEKWLINYMHEYPDNKKTGTYHQVYEALLEEFTRFVDFNGRAIARAKGVA